MRLFRQKVLFTEEECENILKRYSSLPIELVKNSSRNYMWRMVNKVEDKWILDRIIDWIEDEIGCKIDWNNNSDIDEFYFQAYKKGGKFDKHDDNTSNRIYTTGLLLNNDFEGGDFLVDVTPNNSVLFKNVIGNCYIIESMLKHELKEITEGERNIILIFFKNSQVQFNETLNGLPKII